MSVKLLSEHHLCLKGGCTGSSEYILFKIPHYWKSHVTAHIFSDSEYDTEDTDTEVEESSIQKTQSKSDSSTPKPKLTVQTDKKQAADPETTRARANFFTSPPEPLRLDPFKMFGMQRKSDVGKPEKKETEMPSPVMSPSKDDLEIVSKNGVKEKESLEDVGEKEITSIDEGDMEVNPKSEGDEKVEPLVDETLELTGDTGTLKLVGNEEPMNGIEEIEISGNIGDMESDEGTDNQVGIIGLDKKKILRVKL